MAGEESDTLTPCTENMLLSNQQGTKVEVFMANNYELLILRCNGRVRTFHAVVDLEIKELLGYREEHGSPILGVKEICRVAMSYFKQ